MITSETIMANVDLVTTVTVFAIWGAGWALCVRSGSRRKPAHSKS